jgi:peptide/nickel transport system ATP-binding protein/oligopeptide transport system ATP-binding protein
MGAARELITIVGLDPSILERRVHEFSGGQRQRISIARALSVCPRLLLMDEPTSALDVSVQGRILDLMLELQRRLGLTYIVVSHDVSVIRHIADTVAVMKDGQLVESGDASEVLTNANEPYTRSLISSVPRLLIEHPLE